MSVVETQPSASLTSLYLEDEVAWLEIMARLASERRFEEINHENLSEFLTDMAIRERREVLSRLVVLLIHWLKWDYQPKKRSRSWRSTILTQEDDLRLMLESRTLHDHTDEVLARAFHMARKRAAETGLPLKTFPADPTMTVDELLSRSDEFEADLRDGV